MADDNRQLNLPQREEKILEFWERNKIFEKSLESRKWSVKSGRKTGRKPCSTFNIPHSRTFVFYEGPPTANAAPGIHHLESRSFKDLIPRYKTMRGFFVPRKAGWDTHGLPVEIQVEKELGLKTKKDIETYGVAQFNEKCRASVWQFKEEWEKSTKRIGFWLDLERPYITYETSYMESVWRVIKEIWKKGLLYQDFKVVPWCSRCGTGLSTHELGQPGAYQTLKENSIFVKLKIRGKNNEYLLIWTTTPWTLPANVAVAVNPKIEYTKYKITNHKSQVTDKSQTQNSKLQTAEYEYVWSATTPPHDADEKVEVVERRSGHSLLGKEYEPLFHIPKEYSLGSKPEYRVIAGDFVSTEEGTGMVHIAPAFGEDDMRAVKSQVINHKSQTNSKFQTPYTAEPSGFRQNSKLDYPILHTVNADGTMKAGIVGEGKFAKAADADIVGDLEKRGILHAAKPYEHEYPHCWRCGTPLLYFARNAWWIKMTALKEKLLKNNKTINWTPPHIKNGRFGEFLKEVRDWAFSRERFWGTPLPVWKCESCDSARVVGSLAELAEFSARKPRNEYVMLRHGQASHNLTGEVGPVLPRFASSLTLAGKTQIERASRILAKERIDLIFSSDLERAKETAEIVRSVIKKPVSYHAELRDYNIGDYHGMKVEEFHKIFQSTLEKFDRIVPGGESWSDVRKRMAQFVFGLEKKYEGKKILIISHGDPLWLLNASFEGISREEAIRSGWYPETGEVKKLIIPPLPFDAGGEINLHRPYIDGFFLECKKCGGVMKRVSEVIDVWFDSGAMPFAQIHWPFDSAQGGPFAENSKSEILNSKQIQNSKFKIPKLLFPADYISEAVDQTRGWFYTLLAVATLLGKRAPYKNVISLGHVLDKNGQKMSKSKGNIIDPKEMIRKYGADSIRWYFYSINAPGEPKRFDEKDLQLKLRSFLGTLWNSFVFFDTYVDKIPALAYAFGGKATAGKQNPKSENVLDQWILLKLDDLVADVTKRLDAYDITGAARAIEEFTISDFSNWHLRRSRRRFQKPKTPVEKRGAAETAGYTLATLAKVTAPFVPFISEVLWRELRKKLGLKEESVHLASWPTRNPQPATRNKRLLKDMDAVRKIVAEALKMRADAGIKVRQPLAALHIPRSTLNEQLRELIKEEVNVKEISFGKELKFDTTITPELKEEGMVREIVRNIQELRKDLCLHPREKVRAHFSGVREIDEVVEKWKKFIMAEAGADEVSIGGKKTFKAERNLEIDGKQFWIGIDRT
ncbi:MAG: hypothetical protein A2934_02915 [Candidatus Sungbacteria bacterium RIFCSPLOWO2_01_FULL_47_10]|uniref:Isoleucine--tRNA ligase n=1 Tax=Candidatus Sungbacteria bacterium RIFCSPLOWO2_01_FULL_47_10 TaxID=1802276 RepID=A0A1G2L847_9BACT|nr:MAG: hypothetical protein A2934_02915 [Candidatus Sungbacteria bacterium RIFCSPLOWO2_01_FULL_47_10]